MPDYSVYPTPEYLTLPRPDEAWIIKDVLPVGGQMTLYGPPKLGKSYLALQLAAAVSGDTLEWLGYDVAQNGRVIYLQFDTPRIVWQTEHLAHVLKSGRRMERVWHGDRYSLPSPFNILDDDCAMVLQRIVQRINPLVLVVDTFREAHQGDEDKSGAMKLALERLQHVAGTAALVLVAHARKPSEWANTVISGLRGSTYLTGKMDTIAQCGEKTVHLVGRAIANTTIKVQREPYLWTVVLSERQVAQAVAKETGQSANALRMRWRRGRKFSK